MLSKLRHHHINCWSGTRSQEEQDFLLNLVKILFHISKLCLGYTKIAHAIHAHRLLMMDFINQRPYVLNIHSYVISMSNNHLWLLTIPMPGPVPVRMTVPLSRVVPWDRNAIVFRISKIVSLIATFC